MNLEPLKKKLVDTCIHLEQTEADKKCRMSSYTEEIKGAKSRIMALSRAINQNDLAELGSAFNDVEMGELIEMTKETGA